MKKGFTLIELMVVIVIIGILAAIAVPKMFGMSAKAKAAEVMPAWGSWQKVAQAYALEASQIGDFKSIGFTPPGTSSLVNFSTTTNWSFSSGKTGNVNDATGKGVFNATNVVKLNNCVETAAFTAESNVDAQHADYWVSFFTTSGTISSFVPSDADCSVLTPTFK